MRANHNVSLFIDLTSAEQINLSGGASSTWKTNNSDSFNTGSYTVVAKGGDGQAGQSGESAFVSVPEGVSAIAIGGNASQGGNGGDATAIVG
jgi:hypothetical protein